MYLDITHASGYIEEKGVNKYLAFDSTDENKELIEKYNDVFIGIRDKIKESSIYKWGFQRTFFRHFLNFYLFCFFY